MLNSKPMLGKMMRADGTPGMTRREMLRSFVAGASALGLAPLIGACGQSAPEMSDAIAPTVPPAAPLATISPQSTITVWYYDGSIGQTVEAFKRAHPTIGVDLKTFGDADQGLLRALQGGAGLPDVSVFFSGTTGAIAQRGGMADLSAAPFDAAGLKDDFVAAAWNSGLDQQGKLIGMPLSVYPGSYWYRADVLANAGVESDPDKLKSRVVDWPALFDLAREYKAKRAEASLLPRAFFDVFIPQLIQQGGGLVEKAKLLIEEKGAQPAQQALLARKLKLDLPQVDGNAAWDDAIRGGTIAGLFAPTWFQGYISNVYSNLVGTWRSIPAPGGPFLQAAQYLGIPATSTKQELAWAFVKYCCAGVEGQNVLLRTSGDFPAFRTAWADSIYDAPVGFFGEQRVYREWATIAESANMLTPSPYDAAISDSLGIAVRKVIDGEIEVVAAMQDVEQQLIKANPGLTS
jgi:multiple sugar transport system substrate-binding protein